MTSIDHLVLEVTDLAAADTFYTAAFGLGERIRVRAGDEPSTGFRGYAISLVVPQPCDVDSFFATALAAGATTLKPASKSFWGYGGTVQDPFGTIWKLASAEKKNSGPATRQVNDVVLLLGVDNVKATRQFYADRGLPVAKSFGSKYVEFGTSTIKMALYSRKFAAKDSGVSPEGSGSHRIAVGSDAGGFVDLDGFRWESVSA
ncbi:glyoxalase [Catellatospora chokoriensis]|uniref:Glyoxalase n=1 Tax=Catellatospora chokoriensis TaxID=310353 RepID=A0A8J3K1N4_9ACTN|nr:glyoxalase [Catellatospora chokoriensis]GIF91306.1 glyoxalase [Catellatospora chokoriensis]